MLKIYLVLLGIIITTSTFAQAADFVKGGIVDNKTKKVLNNVELILHNSDSTVFETVRTNESGVYKFDNIPFGNYTLSVTDQTYVPVKINLILT